MTYRDDHERAMSLLAASLAGPIAESDRQWLESHVRACAACSSAKEDQYAMVRALKSIPISAPPFLAPRTQALVRSRAREMQESALRIRLLIVSCMLALATTVGMIPLGWQLLTWVSGTGELNSTMTWLLGLAWFWGAPAIAGAALLLTLRNGQPRAFRSAMARRLS